MGQIGDETIILLHQRFFFLAHGRHLFQHGVVGADGGAHLHQAELFLCYRRRIVRHLGNAVIDHAHLLMQRFINSPHSQQHKDGHDDQRTDHQHDGVDLGHLFKGHIRRHGKRLTQKDRHLAALCCRYPFAEHQEIGIALGKDADEFVQRILIAQSPLGAALIDDGQRAVDNFDRGVKARQLLVADLRIIFEIQTHEFRIGQLLPVLAGVHIAPDMAENEIEQDHQEQAQAHVKDQPRGDQTC